MEKKFPQIEYLSDGPAVYEFDGYKTFSLPGAYSVDKWYRLNRGWTWFEDEQLSEEEMNTGRKIKAEEQEFDLVISIPVRYPTNRGICFCLISARRRWISGWSNTWVK